MLWRRENVSSKPIVLYLHSLEVQKCSTIFPRPLFPLGVLKRESGDETTDTYYLHCFNKVTSASHDSQGTHTQHYNYSLLLVMMKTMSCLLVSEVYSVCVGKVKLHHATTPKQSSDSLGKDENQQWMIQKQQIHFCRKR